MESAYDTGSDYELDEFGRVVGGTPNFAVDQGGYPAAPQFDFDLYNRQVAAPTTPLGPTQREADFAAYKQRNPDTATSRTIGNDFAWYKGDAPLPTAGERTAMEEADKGSVSARRYLGMMRYRDAVARGETPSVAFSQNAPLLFGDNPAQFFKSQLTKTITPNTANIRAIPLMTPEGELLGHSITDDSGRAKKFLPKKAAVTTEKMNLADSQALKIATKEESALTAELKTLRTEIAKTPLALKMNPQLGDRLNELPGLIKEAQATQKSLVGKYSTPKGGGIEVPAEVRTPAPARVTTKAQYDALESGAVYTGKDGRKYRKP